MHDRSLRPKSSRDASSQHVEPQLDEQCIFCQRNKHAGFPDKSMS